MDLFDRIIELGRYGYSCGQILALLMQDVTGEEHPDLIRALGGLDGGVGYSKGCCGCMTGGACMISLFTGKRGNFESERPEHKPALGEFTEWFRDEITADYGGIDCEDIIGTNPAKRVECCPQIMAASFEKIMEILQERDLL